MTANEGTRVAVVGTTYWRDVAANLLSRSELHPTVVQTPARWWGLSWALSPTVRQARFVHVVMAGPIVLSLGIRLLVRKRLVWHWIGTDVLKYSHASGLAGVLRKWVAKWLVDLHLSDSPELADELRCLGIDSQVVRLLPASIQADPLPLPDTFRVLSYWSDSRRTFYGGDTVLELARRMPDVEFLIVGARGDDVPSIPNVRFLGRVSDMDEVYAQSSVFVRIPEHDSVSAMVLEALARGRYVVYNKDFPACHQADGIEDVQKALADIRQLTAPNLDGAAYIRREYSLSREAEALAACYRRLGARATRSQ